LLNFVNASQFILQDYSGKSEEFGVGVSGQCIDFLPLTPSETTAQPNNARVRVSPFNAKTIVKASFLRMRIK
jgi:hypothetical protein